MYFMLSYVCLCKVPWPTCKYKQKIREVNGSSKNPVFLDDFFAKNIFLTKLHIFKELHLDERFPQLKHDFRVT